MIQCHKVCKEKSLDRTTPSFIDPKTVAAIVFCIGFLLLWQGHINKKYPSKNQQTVQQNESSPNTEVETNSKETYEQMPKEPNVFKKPEEELFTFEGQNFEFQVSTHGMGLKNIVLKNYFDREQNNISFQNNLPLFATNLEDKELFFQIKRQENKFVGVAKNQNATIRKTLTIFDEKHFIDVVIETIGTNNIVTSFDEKIVLSKSDIPLLPSYDNSSYYVTYGTKEDREILLDDTFQNNYINSALLSIENHYFTRAIIDDSTIKPELNIKYDSQITRVQGYLLYDIPNNLTNATLEQGIYLGPKDKTKLLSADSRLKGALDYGFFAWIAHPIMDMIRLFFKWTGNWGVAIVMMTFVIRMILLPFNMMSHRSMKRLQQIQPKLKALQEKYKDDKLELNKATMAVMRESGANPMGGCLPMLLQFPVFIALFKVLGVSIEFYQAPFLGWIGDLSQRDPYFVLPVLMAASMILHQKISPSTPDPKAKKIMLVMTVVFSLFMVVYPSGLALYIFIGSLFSIAQQLIMTKLEKGG